MFKSAVITVSILGAMIFVPSLHPAQADEADATQGKTPAVRCAAEVETASRTGTVTADATHACQQAVGWAHFVHDEMGPALSNRGVLHLIRDEYQEAIADFDAALRQGADPVSVLNNRGLAQAGLHRYQAAADSYSAALVKATSHQERIYFNRAMAQEDLGNLKAAFLDYRKAAELAPNWHKASDAVARFKVAYPAMV